MKKLNEEKKMTTNGGARYYKCPWDNYQSTSFWRVYAHAIPCGYRHGYFDIPLWMIRKGLGLK